MIRAARPPHDRSDEEDALSRWFIRQRTTLWASHHQALGNPLRFGDLHQILVLRQWEAAMMRLDALEQAVEDVVALGIIPPVYASAKGLVFRHAS